MTTGTPEGPAPSGMRVPRLTGLMAVDARAAADAAGLLLVAADRPDLDALTVEYVVRQYPEPGTVVPRGAAVTVWCDLGRGEEGDDGGAGVREPRHPVPPPGGLRQELDRPPGEQPVGEAVSGP